VNRVIHTVRIAPDKLTQKHHVLVLFVLELASAILIFMFVDDKIPENNFPRGLFITFLAYVLWCGVVYFVNHKYGAYQISTAEHQAHYTQTYLWWGFSMIPFFAVSLIGSLNRYLCSLFGLVSLASGITIMRLLDHKKQK
jgi:hypothetical protein